MLARNWTAGSAGGSTAWVAVVAVTIPAMSQRRKSRKRRWTRKPVKTPVGTCKKEGRDFYATPNKSCSFRGFQAQQGQVHRNRVTFALCWRVVPQNARKGKKQWQLWGN